MPPFASGKEPPFASSKEPLFAYAELDGPGYPLRGVPYVVIDLETTGLSPQEDRIVEIAMARVEGDAVVDEWMTLIDPGRDPGPTFLHHISQEMVQGAPTFRDVVGDILARLDGAIVVAHHAPFEEGFLAGELGRLRIEAAPLPTICTLRLSRAVLASPNYKLSACCEIMGIELTDAHTALGDVRATAQLLPRLLAAAPHIRFPVEPMPLPRYPRLVGPRTRVTNLRRGDDGWIHSLMSKLPVSMSDHDPIGAQPYLDYLSSALAEGKLTGRQTRILGRLAGRAGMGAAQVGELHKRFLDGLRDEALRVGALTEDHQRQLVTVARLLNEPGYFADLVPDTVVPAPTHGPRVWCSPAVPQQTRRSLSDAGYQLSSNITRTLTAAVVAPGDEQLPRTTRAVELGTRIVALDRLDTFLGVSVPPRDRLPAPTALAGWYPDPTGRHLYRFWNGAMWTERVSPGGTAILIDELA
jgi:DNA polymerase III subunit epsilon